jgi:hypothetical protein
MPVLSDQLKEKGTERTSQTWVLLCCEKIVVTFIISLLMAFGALRKTFPIVSFSTSLGPLSHTYCIFSCVAINEPMEC